MRIGFRFLVLAIVGSLAPALAAAAEVVRLQAHDPLVDSFFIVYTDLRDPIYPPNPCDVNLANATHPVLTQDVANEGHFDFGMRGRTGESFAFRQIFDDPPMVDPWHLVLHFEALGSLGSFFDVFFDASYRDDAGIHPPASGDLWGTPPNPVFPPGSFTLRYLMEVDPPFSVGIFMLNPSTGNDDPVTFQQVPEPGALTLFLLGAVAVAGRRWRWQESCQRE